MDGKGQEIEPDGFGGVDGQGESASFGALTEAFQSVESERSGHYFDLWEKGKSEISHH